MSELVKQYSIGAGVVEKHEAGILTDLPALYPDEGQRQIVESVLLPHFRAELAKVFNQFREGEVIGSDQPVVPSRLPGLCEAVDKMMGGNRTLLDLDGMFKPLMERIQVARGEIAEALKAQFYQHCRDILAGHGVVDRESLLRKGSRWFVSADFSPYGKGKAFAGGILGRVMVAPTHVADLNEIADVLGFEKLSRDAELKKYREVLAGYGITDRQGLLDKGPVWFVTANFPPYGRGKAFAGKILGSSFKNVDIADLNRIADVLGFEKLSREEELQKYREALEKHGITDRQSLLRKRTRWFLQADFPPYGKGLAFAGKILGESLENVDIADLNRIADVLGFEKPSKEEELKKYRETLEKHGVTDRQGLVRKGPIWFARANFPPYGKGYAFAGKILGRVAVTPIRIADIEEISDVLKLPILSDESKESFRAALGKHGVTDRQSLLKKRVSWFIRANFPPYGEGPSFAGRILGRFMNWVRFTDIEQIADILWPGNLSAEDTKNLF